MKQRKTTQPSAMGLAKSADPNFVGRIDIIIY